MPLHPLDNLRDKVRSLHERHERKRSVTLFGKPHASTAAQTGKAADGPSKHEPGPIARLVDAWWTRLIAAVYDGGLAAQEAEYGSGETARDYLWNTVGTGAWGMVFPVLTVVATQLAGIKQAGMFSMAFAAGTLLMFLSNFGVRTYQVSDIDEKCSFASYQAQRLLTSLLALAAGLLYCTVRGYDATMLMLSIGIYIYKIVDGLADVYEGRLQQADKLYLAGISQALRSVSVIIAFSVLLFITRSIALAGAAAGLAAVATLILVTIPLALLETEASRRMNPLEIGGLFRHCLPLFSALFMFNLIESVPKFAMEGMLPLRQPAVLQRAVLPRSRHPARRRVPVQAATAETRQHLVEPSQAPQIRSDRPGDDRRHRAHDRRHARVHGLVGDTDHELHVRRGF